jgi:hypothetical protein
MAPDLNSLASWSTDGYANNQVPRNEYEIPGELTGYFLCLNVSRADGRSFTQGQTGESVYQATTGMPWQSAWPRERPLRERHPDGECPLISAAIIRDWSRSSGMGALAVEQRNRKRTIGDDFHP